MIKKLLLLCVLATTAFGAVNWHPGHYLLVGQSKNTPISSFEKAKDAKFRGVQKRYWWRDLEPTKDNYDFSQIFDDVRAVRNMTSPVGTRYFVVQIQIKDFTGGHPTPDYLWNTTTAAYRSQNPMGNGQYAYGEFNEGDNAGSGEETRQAMYWIPGVNTRLRALYTALRDAINAEPDAADLRTTIESIVINETACEEGVAPDGLNRQRSGYTQQKCVDAIKSNLTLLNSLFPGMTIIQYINFLPPPSGPADTPTQVSYLTQIANHCTTIDGLGIGCPDVRGINPPGYTVLRNFQTQMPISGSVQGKDYKDPETLDSVWDKGLNVTTDTPWGLGSHYMVWLDMNSTAPEYGFRLGDGPTDTGTVRHRVQNTTFPNSAKPDNIP